MTLTLQQAVGQKLMVSFRGTEPSAEMLALLREQHVGGVTLFRHLNVVNPAQVRRLTAALQQAAANTNQPPLLIGVDQEGGQFMAIGNGTTYFPGNMALGATDSTDLAYRTGYALGRELLAMGINIDYAPSVDVNNNPHNPVIGTRSFGENPQQVAQLGAALIGGLQAAGVAATVKHFPGHGDTATDTHHGLAVVPHERPRLDQVELPPFVAAIKAGVQLVMSAHLGLPALEDGLRLPATLSRRLLQGLLRDELGFRGVIISDAMDMGAIVQGPGLIVDALTAMAAGIDLLLLKAEDAATYRQVYQAAVQAVQRRLLDPAHIAASAARVLRLKQWVAQHEQPPLDVVGSAEHQALAHEIAARSITLVRDNARQLPLVLGANTRIAVIVPRPVDLTPADTSSYVHCTLAEALRRYHPLVDEYVVEYEPNDNDIAALKQRMADYQLVVVGTINAAPGSQQAALVNALLATPTPVIAVGLRMPYDLAAYAQAQTYVCTYSILPPSMEALAQALVGYIPFAGRLPVSIPGLYALGHSLQQPGSVLP